MAEENRSKLTDEALEQVSGGARGAERSAPKRRNPGNYTVEPEQRVMNVVKVDVDIEQIKQQLLDDVYPKK